MECPPKIVKIAQTLLAANAGLTTTEDQARLFMRLVAEQVVFELGPSFGLKAAGPGRPQGPSQIAYNNPAVDVPFGGWRILEGVGNPNGTPATVIARPIFQTFPNQIFLAVTGVDHLHTADAPKDLPPAPVPVQPDLSTIYDRLDQIERTLKVIMDDWSVVLDDIHRIDHRRYVAKFLGMTLVSVPETVKKPVSVPE